MKTFIQASIVVTCLGLAGTAQADKQLNGRHLNGQHLNGQHLNGQHLNGQHLNGQHLNGQDLTEDNPNATETQPLPPQSFKIDCMQAKAGKLVNICKR